MQFPLAFPEYFIEAVWPNGASYMKDRTKDFIENLGEFGSHDNRYLLRGHKIDIQSVTKIDQLTYLLRRICRPLPADFNWSDSLGDWRLRSNLPIELIFGGDPAQQSRALRDRNPFWESMVESTGYSIYPPAFMVNGSAENVVFAAVGWARDYRTQKDAAPVFLRWLIDNVKIDKERKTEIRAFLKRHSAD